MNNNPEFLRNLWLELTPHRLIGMPAVLLAVFFLIYLVTGHAFSDPTRITAMTLYFVLALLWGTRLAGEALVNEVQDRTWDQQRMSSISPWAMAWGKLFGSTVYTWYGAIICLLIYAVSAMQTNQADVIKQVIFMLAIVVFGQSIALLSSMQNIKTYHRSASTAFMVMGIIVALPLISWGFNETGYLSWYNQQYRVLDFLMVSVVCFAGWSLVGIYRKMREELQFRNTPVYWFVFCVFLALYLAGAIPAQLLGDELTTFRIFVAYSTFIVLAYVMVVLEDKNPLLLRRIIAARKQRNWRGVFENVPCWFVTLLSAYILCIVLMFNDYPDIKFAARGFELKPYLLAIVLFLTRDVLLFILFNMTANRRRADVTAMFYLVLLYWLLPSILSGLNLPMATAALLPIGTHDATISIASGFVQCAAIAFLVLQRWRNLYNIPD